VVPDGFETFSLDAALERRFLFEKIEGDAVKQGEVLRSVASAFATSIFVEGHIRHPV
jgi:hypothetical protein